MLRKSSSCPCLSSMDHPSSGSSLARSSIGSQAYLAPKSRRASNRASTAVNVLPLAMAAFDSTLFDSPAAFASILGSEVQLEAALHVPAYRAIECMQAFGSSRQAPSLAAAVRSLETVHSGKEWVPNGVAHLLEGVRDSEASLAACLASPPEIEELQTRQREAEQTMTRSLYQLHTAQEVVNVVDRYNVWVRRISRKRRTESLHAFLALLAAIPGLQRAKSWGRGSGEQQAVAAAAITQVEAELTGIEVYRG